MPLWKRKKETAFNELQRCTKYFVMMIIFAVSTEMNQNHLLFPKTMSICIITSLLKTWASSEQNIHIVAKYNHSSWL